MINAALFILNRLQLGHTEPGHWFEVSFERLEKRGHLSCDYWIGSLTWRSTIEYPFSLTSL